MIKYYCDFCKNETLDKHEYILPEEVIGYYAKGCISVNICEDCQEKMLNFFNSLKNKNKREIKI